MQLESLRTELQEAGSSEPAYTVEETGATQTLGGRGFGGECAVLAMARTLEMPHLYEEEFSVLLDIILYGERKFNCILSYESL